MKIVLLTCPFPHFFAGLFFSPWRQAASIPAHDTSMYSTTVYTEARDAELATLVHIVLAEDLALEICLTPFSFRLLFS